MSNDGQWAASRGNQTAPVAPHPTVAQNSAILDKNKNVSAEIDKQVSDSRTKRINTAAEHAKGFADLNARLDRANQAVGAAQGGNRSAARTIMEQPIRPSFDPAWSHQPQRRAYNQMYKMYNDVGAGSGMWTPAAREAMVDEAGSTTQQGRQNFLTAGKLQDFYRKHGR
jgi:soluble cytochrome b562